MAPDRRAEKENVVAKPKNNFWLAANTKFRLITSGGCGCAETWGRGGGGPELGLRDLAALRSQTFAVFNYPF